MKKSTRGASITETLTPAGWFDRIRSPGWCSLAIWLAGTVILSGILGAFGAFGFSAADRRVWFVIAGGSYLVSVLASAPRWWLRRRGGGQIPSDQIMAAFAAGILVRLSGTVALFLAVRYEYRAAEVWIAAWVLAWHVGLLWLDVGLSVRFDSPSSK